MKILHGVDPKYLESIEKNAKLVGLDQIDSGRYNLRKTGSTSSPEEKYDQYINHGDVRIVGDDKYVWIAVMNIDSWFKTSQVIKCTKTDKGFDIETKNSFY